MQSNYTIMRRIKIQPQFAEEAVQKIEQFFAQPLRKEPGFLEFYSVQVGENELLTISLFKSREEAEQGTRRALKWARESIFPLAEASTEIADAGEVRLHQKKEDEEKRVLYPVVLI